MTQRPKANGQQQAVHNGAEGARTPDLLGAIQALSQLSYSPDGTRNVNPPPPTSNPFNLTTTRPPIGRTAGQAVGRSEDRIAVRQAARPPPYISRPMRTVSFIHSGLVGAQIDKVFDLLTDPARVPDWLPGCQTVKRVDGPPGKGQRWRLRMQTPFRIADLVVEVIEYEPPTGFAWAELQPRSGSKTYFKLAFAGGATEVTKIGRAHV